MREIKFRAWDPEGKQMCYDEAVQVCQIDIDHNGFLRIRNFKENGDFYELFPMQSTGLVDKNLREIWEGDILHWLAIEYKTGKKVVDENVVVSWQANGGRWVVELNGMDENLFQDRTKRWEVLGNIYENPELLGGPNAS